MSAKQNVVISTKDGAPASKILKSLANFLQGARVNCCFKLPKGESILVGEGKPLFTVVFHSTTFLLKGLTELNIGRAYTEVMYKEMLLHLLVLPKQNQCFRLFIAYKVTKKPTSRLKIVALIIPLP